MEKLREETESEAGTDKERMERKMEEKTGDRQKKRRRPRKVKEKTTEKQVRKSDEWLEKYWKEREGEETNTVEKREGKEKENEQRETKGEGEGEKEGFRINNCLERTPQGKGRGEPEESIKRRGSVTKEAEQRREGADHKEETAQTDGEDKSKEVKNWEEREWPMEKKWEKWIKRQKKIKEKKWKNVFVTFEEIFRREFNREREHTERQDREFLNCDSLGRKLEEAQAELRREGADHKEETAQTEGEDKSKEVKNWEEREWPMEKKWEKWIKRQKKIKEGKWKNVFVTFEEIFRREFNREREHKERQDREFLNCDSLGRKLEEAQAKLRREGADHKEETAQTEGEDKSKEVKNWEEREWRMEKKLEKWIKRQKKIKEEKWKNVFMTFETWRNMEKLREETESEAGTGKERMERKMEEKTGDRQKKRGRPRKVKEKTTEKQVGKSDEWLEKYWKEREGEETNTVEKREGKEKENEQRETKGEGEGEKEEFRINNCLERTPQGKGRGEPEESIKRRGSVTKEAEKRREGADHKEETAQTEGEDKSKEVKNWEERKWRMEKKLEKWIKRQKKIKEEKLKNVFVTFEEIFRREFNRERERTERQDRECLNCDSLGRKLEEAQAELRKRERQVNFWKNEVRVWQKRLAQMRRKKLEQRVEREEGGNGSNESEEWKLDSPQEPDLNEESPSKLEPEGRDEERNERRERRKLIKIAKQQIEIKSKEEPMEDWFLTKL
ncbi:golgin subfamily A member 6-like protein 22 [Diachasmimorpha longicaudata]|uniref:golgin subfamily A member 6-like protein 22 n=1 Tax=Diachasmimorpha longicaudata TaxID=58733 RepID=UPI0030B8F854